MRSHALIGALAPHAARVIDRPLRDLLADDPDRAATFSRRLGPLHVSIARQRIDREAWDALLALAQDLPGALRRLADGEPVNTSERRAALHTALRAAVSDAPAAVRAHAEAESGRARMAAVAAALAESPVTDVISVGIGGSDLGPRLVADALREHGQARLRVHFLANIDGLALQRLTATLDPARTAVVLVSKSFTTAETLHNGALLRDWLGGAERLYAVTAHAGRAAAFGIPSARVLPMWDWVGGRYSLWSPVGVGAYLALGDAAFAALLEGAAQMDRHVLDAPPGDNLAVWHALVAVWNRVALGCDTQAVIGYDERLQLLPAHLQQLVMESLGKSVTPDGHPAGLPTAPVVWGGIGSTVQHSFMQALHQGTDTVPVDFIAALRPDHPHRASHDALLANLLAQAETLANGFDSDDPQRLHPGNRPSTVMLVDRLDPHALGMLLALYEHSVYLQAVLLGINAFDQWGVERGKHCADDLLPAVVARDPALASDAVTRALLAELRDR